MGILQAFVAIKLIGRLQGALFHFMENGLHIYGYHAFHIKIDIRTQHFFRQQRNIEPVGIKAGEITVPDHGVNFL